MSATSSQPAPIHTFRTRRRVEFSDTDMAGIIHFARYFVYMETAEHELLNAIGTSVHATIDGVAIGWPRLRASCEFLRPVRFEDVVEITVRVRRKGSRSLTWGFELTHEGETVARGELVTVCCELRAGEPPRSIPIPDSIARRIAESPAVADGTMEPER
jgi:4-hydroxybenzoyl-CoA thioesterase/acyl-CoA thioester hydrolase